VSDQLPPGRIKDIRVYRDSFVGMAILACVPFLIFGALQVYGWWAALAMFLAWTVLLAIGTRWFMPHPRRVVGLGLAAVGMWALVVVLNR
jgi:hypothetical protein